MQRIQKGAGFINIFYTIFNPVWIISLTNGLSSVKSFVLKGFTSRSIDILRIYLFNFFLIKKPAAFKLIGYYSQINVTVFPCISLNIWTEQICSLYRKFIWNNADKFNHNIIYICLAIHWCNSFIFSNKTFEEVIKLRSNSGSFCILLISHNKSIALKLYESTFKLIFFD